MFTGIIEEVGTVGIVRPGRLTLKAGGLLAGMAAGDSVAVNGVCLTATEIATASFIVDVMPETLRRTNLGQLRAGDRVNLERAVPLGGRLGGHLVQGHIDDTGSLLSVTPEGAAKIARFEAPAAVMYYIVEKGFIAVDGISLTVAGADNASFAVSVVTHTWENTNLAQRRVGDRVNLEVDIIAKYVRRFSQDRGPGVTLDLLEEHGFTVG